MIKKGLFKTLALGFCISALFAGVINVGTAYAKSGGGLSASSKRSFDSQDSDLFEKQRELDQYIFIDNVDKIESMGFEVIYTGVSDRYVEVGITPYNNKNADYIYGIFGDDLVKVVDTDAVELYDIPDAGEDVDEPVDHDKVVSPTMDMGDDTPVSDSDADEGIIIEREKLIDDEEEESEEFSIQIESIGGDEQGENVAPDLMWQTGIDEDLPNQDKGLAINDDHSDVNIVVAEDNMVAVTSSKDTVNEDKDVPTESKIALVVGGIIIVGGVASIVSKKKLEKKKKNPN